MLVGFMVMDIKIFIGFIVVIIGGVGCFGKVIVVVFFVKGVNVVVCDVNE